MRAQNDDLQTKYKLICKKIVDNIDLSEYAFIEPDTEPHLIDIRDLFHMVQKLSLLANTVNTNEKIESHMERLESRITELANENSDFMKTKFKLQERLEFIMQERDVWKRNAETLKAMYSKLVKEHQAESLVTINKCVVGAHTANIDNKKPNQRIFTANIPKKYNDTLLNYQALDKKFENKINEITLSQQKILAVTQQTNENFFQKNFEQTNLESIESAESIRSLEAETPVSANTEYTLERPMTSMTNRRVSFNKEIDVRVYPKNSKNTKLIESYLMPLTATPIPSELPSSNSNEIILPTTNRSSTAPSMYLAKENENTPNEAVQTQIRNLLNKRNSISSDSSDKANEYTLNLLRNINNTAPTSVESRFTNRASICSNRKYPGETPVKDLEPTLKMIIIKELSVDKVDGNDWKMFARKIGISENEIEEWKSLKLQYPMARVLSFWSGRPDATARLLHRHLISSCFNYSSLAKRIENFYDVV